MFHCGGLTYINFCLPLSTYCLQLALIPDCRQEMTKRLNILEEITEAIE
jgi:hypothetical protein